MRAERAPRSRIQGWFTDTRTPARRMKVAHHPESGVVVLSLWRGDRCTGTFRLCAGELVRLQHLLVDAAASGGGGDRHSAPSSGGPAALGSLRSLLRRRGSAPPPPPVTLLPPD